MFEHDNQVIVNEFMDRMFEDAKFEDDVTIMG